MAIKDTIELIIGAGKKLREVAQRMKDAETQLAIADLLMAMSNLKIQVAELQEESLDLRTQLEAARQTVAIRETLERRKGAYYLKEPPPGYHEGPYCVACMDQKGILQTVSHGRRPKLGDTWECPACRAVTSAFHGP